MPVDALVFTSIDCDEVFAAKRVFAPRHRFEMRRIYAGPVSTEVVDVQPVRDGPECLGIGEPVHLRMVRAVPEVSVALAVLRAGPPPAIAWRTDVNVPPETDRWVNPRTCHAAYPLGLDYRMRRPPQI
jgi:hypothetical protein